MKKPTKQLEYPDAPSGFVTLYQYKEPFMEFEEGYGYRGVLLFDGKTDKVQCHFCGIWTTYLPAHLRKEHNMKAGQYKQSVGLLKNSALIGETIRETMVEAARERDSFKNRKYRKYTEEEKKKYSEAGKEMHSRMERKNITNTCPKQLLVRLHKVYKKLGRTPKEKEVPFHNTLIKNYGSMKEAFRLAGIPYRKPGNSLTGFKKGKYDPAELLNDLIRFELINSRQPSASDCRRGLLPAYQNYQYHFGSWKNAIKLAFE